MTCEYCGAEFVPKHPRARFCRPVCRLAAWNGQRRAKLEAVETLLLRAVDQVRAIRQTKPGR